MCDVYVHANNTLVWLTLADLFDLDPPADTVYCYWHNASSSRITEVILLGNAKGI